MWYSVPGMFYASWNMYTCSMWHAVCVTWYILHVSCGVSQASCGIWYVYFMWYGIWHAGIAEGEEDKGEGLSAALLWVLDFVESEQFAGDARPRYWAVRCLLDSLVIIDTNCYFESSFISAGPMPRCLEWWQQRSSLPKFRVWTWIKTPGCFFCSYRRPTVRSMRRSEPRAMHSWIGDALWITAVAMQTELAMHCELVMPYALGNAVRIGNAIWILVSVALPHQISIVRGVFVCVSQT